MEKIEEDNSDYFSKYQENENIPLSPSEVIDNINKKIKIKSKNNSKNYANYIYLIILILLFFLIKYILVNISDIEYKPANFPNLNEMTKKIIHNEDNYTINDSYLPKNQTFNIAFLYSSLFGNGIARFMVVTGEYFIRKGYNVYFLTKQPYSKDFKFNKNIKRIYACDNFTMISNTIKGEKIDFLIVNNVFDANFIKALKNIGVKVIGIYHGVYLSSIYNNITWIYKFWKNVEYFDAYIHISADDYFFFKNFGFQKNIFIPNLYTFDPNEVPSSNLSNHNLMMLGRLNDKKKGVEYAIKAMELIAKEVPDAKLFLVSSDSRIEEFKNMSIELNLTKNIFFERYVEKISDFFLNSSIFLFTSLTEAFPMALNEAKAYGLPCITFDISYSIPIQSGVIQVEMFNHKSIAKEAIKLLKDYDYRIQKGKEAKLSLKRFNNEDTTNLWERLFHALKYGENEFQKFRREIEKKYYNETNIEIKLEKQFDYAKRFNKYFKCHSFKNISNLEYINNIEDCKNIE